MPSYKRLTLMLRDPERLKALLLDPERPVQIVIAGKAHPADDGGKQLIQQIVRFADDPEIRHRIVFLPDYDIGMARYLYCGLRRLAEQPAAPARGLRHLRHEVRAQRRRSTCRSATAGGTRCSTARTAGRSRPPTASIDADRRDDLEAAALYDLVEKQVAPRFYDRDADGVPARWVEMVRHTLTTRAQGAASRMVRDYVEQLYAPAARVGARVMSADGYAPARAGRRAHLLHNWST